VKKNNKAFISVVVPVYKEEANVPPFLVRTRQALKKAGLDFEILFCLDPSPDRTEEIIRQEIHKDPAVRLLRFSRRYGQPAATLAGIHAAEGDAVVVIDVDLQDPPELIPDMVKKWSEGNEVVYAKRRSRKGETLVKEMVSKVGYKVINKISDVDIPRDTGDFRLMSRKVVEEIKRLKEGHGFLRGLVAFVGFKQAALEYDRDERAHGKGNYNRYLGSLKIAMNGVVSFSSRPLQFVSLAGLAMALLGFLVGLWYILQKWVLHMDLTPGLSTTVVAVTFFAGIQLVCLGLMGEYVGRIYDEVKMRPPYIIDEVVGSGRKGRKRR
jgi:dolichol-phosphate mannosyltransferase